MVLLAAIAIPTLVIALLPNVETAADATVVAGSDRGLALGREVASRSTIERQDMTSKASLASTSTSLVISTTASTAPSTTTTSVSTTTTAPSIQVAGPTTSAPPVAPVQTPQPPTTVASAVVSPPTTVVSGDLQAFLACIRRRESGGNYQIVSSNGLYHGAYQFLQSSWDSTAAHAGRVDLIGVPPEKASPADQDAMAIALFQWQGARPWGGACV